MPRTRRFSSADGSNHGDVYEHVDTDEEMRFRPQDRFAAALPHGMWQGEPDQLEQHNQQPSQSAAVAVVPDSIASSAAAGSAVGDRLLVRCRTLKSKYPGTQKKKDASGQDSGAACVTWLPAGRGMNQIEVTDYLLKRWRKEFGLTVEGIKEISEHLKGGKVHPTLQAIMELYGLVAYCVPLNVDRTLGTNLYLAFVSLDRKDEFFQKFPTLTRDFGRDTHGPAKFNIANWRSWRDPERRVVFCDVLLGFRPSGAEGP